MELLFYGWFNWLGCLDYFSKPGSPSDVNGSIEHKRCRLEIYIQSDGINVLRVGGLKKKKEVQNKNEASAGQISTRESAKVYK